MLVATTLLLSLPFRWIAPPTSSIMLQRHFSGRSEGRVRPRYPWRDWKDISPHLAAVLPNPAGLSASQPSEYVRERPGTISLQLRRLGGADHLCDAAEDPAQRDGEIAPRGPGCG